MWYELGFSFFFTVGFVGVVILWAKRWRRKQRVEIYRKLRGLPNVYDELVSYETLDRIIEVCVVMDTQAIPEEGRQVFIPWDKIGKYRPGPETVWTQMHGMQVSLVCRAFGVDVYAVNVDPRRTWCWLDA